MIEYKWGKGNEEGNVLVFLDNKRVGTIKKVKNNKNKDVWQYFPLGSKYGGVMYKILEDCKISLERE